MNLRRNLTLSDLYALRDKIRNSKEDPFILASSPFYWFVHWTNDAIGYFALSILLRRPVNYWAYAKKQFRSFASVFLRPSYRLEMPRNFSNCNGNLIFSWTNGSGIDQILQGQDRYYGRLRHPQDSGTLRVYFLYPPYTLSDVRRLVERGFGVAYQPSGMEEKLKDLRVILRHFPRQHRAWLKLLNYDGLSFIPLVQQIDSMVVMLGLKRVFFPYEGQPVQNSIIFKLAERNVESIGYLHSSGQNFPSFLIHRPGCPKVLLVHGSAYRDVLEEYCGWPRGSIKEVDCYRFSKRDRSDFESKIFLPYSFSSKDLIVKGIKSLVGKFPEYFDLATEVRIHPAMKGVTDHIELANAVRNCLPCQSTRTKACTVVVGISTTVLEALENGVGVVFQITEDAYMESFSKEIWQAMEADFITSNLIRYRLPTKGTFLRLKEDPPSFDELVESYQIDSAKSET